MSVAAIDPGPRPAVAGDNLTPAMKAFETHVANVDDVYAEAKHWLDGQPIENQAQHDKVEMLLDMIRDAHDAADGSRKAEKKPHDDAAAEVQERYNPYISENPKKPGKTARAKAACLAALTVWRNKVEAERAARAAALAQEAQAKEAAAAEAIRAASGSTDLQAREDAEALLIDAKRTAHAATQATAGATGLRTTKTPVLEDAALALKWYINAQPERIIALLMDLAKEDFRAKKFAIPGFRSEDVKTAF